MKSTQEKKEFIQHLLKNHITKRRECTWVLKYLLSNDSILQQVHFTEEVHKRDLGMLIGFEGTAAIPFRFHIGDVMSGDVEKAFNKMRTMDKETKFYIEVSYPNKQKDVVYTDMIGTDVTTECFPQELDSIMSSILFMNKERYVNEALDSNDKELFYQLTGGEV